IRKIWCLFDKINSKLQITNHKQIQNSKFKSQNINIILHKTIKGVGEDLEKLKFNTAIAKLMTLSNAIQEQGCKREDFENFLIMISPFAPHLAEELWAKLGNKKSIFKERWPKYDPKLVKDELIELVIQVNGKVRDRLEERANINEKDAKELALKSEKIKKWISGKKVIKVIFVKGKLVNVVIK
ncbi:MAG: class I tRNA ligase family protein, partial [Patescibacteria group bacterium]